MKKQVKKKPETSVRLVRKANELVEARYKFDIWETRVFAKMLSLVKPEDSDFKLYDIHIGELLRDFRLHDKGDNYQAIRQATKKLMTRLIEIERETPEGMKWYAMPLLVGAEGFIEPKDGSYISVQFHEKLKPYLLELKERYLQYDIRNLWGLSSVYSVRIYELLKQFEKIGKRHFDIYDLRNRLAIEPTEYLKYNHFKSKILLKAQADLAKYTDISFEMEERKHGKRVAFIHFTIHSNTPSAKVLKPLPESTEAIPKEKPKMQDFAQAKDWGINQETLKNLLAEFGEEAVAHGIACTLDSIKAGKVKENPGGFFVKSVKMGWESAEQLKAKKIQQAKKKREAERASARQTLQDAEEQLTMVEDSRRFEVNEVIRVLTQEDPFLAGEAVDKIIKSTVFKSILEKQTGLTLTDLPMDAWRQNKPLREAVIRQIESMRPEAFKEIQENYDDKLKLMHGRIKLLKQIIERPD